MIHDSCGVRVVGLTDWVYSVENQHLNYVCGSPRYFILGRATAIIYVPMQVSRSLRCAPPLRPQDFPASEGPRLYPLDLCSLLTNRHTGVFIGADQLLRRYISYRYFLFPGAKLLG